MSSLENLYNEWKKYYPDIPLEAYFKQDMLRLGISFDSTSLLNPGTYKTKDYFIFSFDRIPLNEMTQEENWKAPEEIRFLGGEYNLQQTVVSVRINPKSPYKVFNIEGQLKIFYQNNEIASVLYPDIPEYYTKKYKTEKLPGEIAPVIEWGYLIYLTVFRNCQYFGKDEECMFCDINHNWRQQKQSGRPYTGIKPVEDIIEVLNGIDQFDHVAKAYTLTGGSVVTQLGGKNEIDFYGQYAKIINERFPGRWISKVVTQAYEQEDVKKLKDCGIEIYHPNYEVWDADIFNQYCPGKARYIGRDNWNRRIIESARVFGNENVIPNFVAGVELAGPRSFKSVDTAVMSTLEGLDYFMSHGISPRFTTWCPEPYTSLGDQSPAPLEYYMKLLRGYKQTWKKYNLPVPPGYGPPGVGKAVFSVSAFMDVLE
ncbi:MAG: radical SAM protein [Spirochaetia bacterium]|nr:radical SAM protein [Spirochaetia bacterium]